MQIDFERGLTSSWVAFSDIVTPDSNETYLIQNRGPDVLLLYKSDTEPSEDSVDGVLIEPYCYAKYSADAELYLRAFNNNCSINISTVEGQGGGGGSANIEAITVTPSTSAQTITASGGVDGYSPITVSAVTSSIDANIVAGNIKDGVSILSVTGELVPSDTVEAINNASSAVSAGDKVWVNPEEIYNYNFNVYGSPTINNTTKVVSNFSTSNYLQLQNAFNPGSSTWEIQAKVTTGNNVSEGYIFRSCISAPQASGRFGLSCFIISGNFYLASTTDGTSFVYFNAGTHTISTNTTYWLKIGWTGSQYYLKYSLDGTTYTDDIVAYDSTPVYNGLQVTQLGIFTNDTYRNPWLGTMDLSGWKIIINGADWWVPSFTKLADCEIIDFGNITVNTLTGVAAENIAILGTGDVNTVLPNS